MISSSKLLTVVVVAHNSRPKPKLSLQHLCLRQHHYQILRKGVSMVAMYFHFKVSNKVTNFTKKTVSISHIYNISINRLTCGIS